jgi:hypothetical protein
MVIKGIKVDDFAGFSTVEEFEGFARVKGMEVDDFAGFPTVEEFEGFARVKGMEVDDFTGFSVVDEIDLVGSPFKLEFTDRNATT